MEHYETIPWDFLGLLAAVFAVAALTVCCAFGLKAWRRTRLTDPRKDHVYKTRETHIGQQ